MLYVNTEIDNLVKSANVSSRTKRGIFQPFGKLRFLTEPVPSKIPQSFHSFGMTSEGFEMTIGTIFEFLLEHQDLMTLENRNLQ
jgi:hypothetical protein